MANTIKIELTEAEAQELISLIVRGVCENNTDSARKYTDKLFKELHKDRLDQEQKVRKYRKGVYRVYVVYHMRSNVEERYATKALALDYIQRRGGQLFEEDFNDKAEAQVYLDEARGDIWW